MQTVARIAGSKDPVYFSSLVIGIFCELNSFMS